MAHRDQGLLAQLLYHFSLRICMLIIVKNNSSNSSYILVEVIFCCPVVLCLGGGRTSVLRWNPETEDCS
jgi:hypothetical protein